MLHMYKTYTARGKTYVADCETKSATLFPPYVVCADIAPGKYCLQIEDLSLEEFPSQLDTAC